MGMPGLLQQGDCEYSERDNRLPEAAKRKIFNKYIPTSVRAGRWARWSSVPALLPLCVAACSIYLCAAPRGGAGESLEYCPPDERIPPTWWLGGLGACAVFCTAVLSPLMSLPAYEPAAAVVLALLVAVLAVRALGQTDLNPVSGVGKLSQARASGARLPEA